MKKILLTLLMAAIPLSLVGCGDTPDADRFYYLDGDRTDGDEPETVDGDVTDQPPLSDGDAMQTDGDTIVPDGDEADGDEADGDDEIADIDGDSETELHIDGDEEELLTSCDFDYNFQYDRSLKSASRSPNPPQERVTDNSLPAAIAHAEPPPLSTYSLKLDRLEEELVMPEYEDNQPIFPRSLDWAGDRRCFEFDGYAQYLNENQAYELYADIIRRTLWYDIDRRPEIRSVLGLRGSYPGGLTWHGNLPNRFNDTIVLLWIDSTGKKNVREYPVNTDTGAIDFGVDSSSSLRANRRYLHDNGWHRGYNALSINMWGYGVQDDTNNNGHWDSDRNGWLPPFYGEDHHRGGSGHNIHMAGAWDSLDTAPVDNWSAGCQTIAGELNWRSFITQAWTGEGDAIHYYLIDTRDIVWKDCPRELGTWACPFEIRELPFTHSGDTSTSNERRFDRYNCSEADEGGAELVYVMNLRDAGTLHAAVEVQDEDSIDPDLHILEGEDADACRDRAHEQLDHVITPGRYLIVVDTFVNGEGMELPGPYTLSVTLD